MQEAHSSVQMQGDRIMPLTAEEETKLLKLKHQQKMAFEKEKHKNNIQELNKQLEIVKAGNQYPVKEEEEKEEGKYEQLPPQ